MTTVVSLSDWLSWFFARVDVHLLSAGALSRAVGALEANPTAVLAFGPETNTDEYRAERWPVAAATWQLVDNPAFLRRSFRTLGLGPGYGSMLVRTAV